MTQTVVLADGGLEGIPEEILRQLSLMIRYVPSASRAGRHACSVTIEERLMLGASPLTNWVKHEEEVGTTALDAEAIKRLSCLRIAPEKEGLPASYAY